MRKLITAVLLIGVTLAAAWYIFPLLQKKETRETNHNMLVDHIEAMGKLELVKYRISDIVEHKDVSAYLPEASVLLIIKADAVGCIDLRKVSRESLTTVGDSVHIILPSPEICYIKIDHNGSKVYDTKMAFFREAALVDEAYKRAEREIRKEIEKSDILTQTKNNAILVLRPLLEGLGFNKVSIEFY